VVDEHEADLGLQFGSHSAAHRGRKLPQGWSAPLSVDSVMLRF